MTEIDKHFVLPQTPPAGDEPIHDKLDYILDDLMDYWLNPARYSEPLKKGDLTFKAQIRAYILAEVLKIVNEHHLITGSSTAFKNGQMHEQFRITQAALARFGGES